MPDAQQHQAQTGPRRRHPARKTLREGYLRFDGQLGLIASAPVVVPRSKSASPIPMYDRSDVIGSRRVRKALRVAEDASALFDTRDEDGAPGKLRRHPRRLGDRKQADSGAAPKPPGAPVTFLSGAAATESLDGSSLPSGERPHVGDVRQWSGTVLRVFDMTSTGSTRHRVKLRVVIFFDGKNVVRYSLFRDPDSVCGFESPSRYELSFRQAQVLPPRDERPAEVHLRYDGKANVQGKGSLVFEGMIIVRGTGKVVCTEPNVISGNGKATVLRCSATVGWW
jgi:hypothetical protein